MEILLRLLSLIAAICTTAQTGLAEISIESVREDLNSNSFDLLEQKFDFAFQGALENKNFDALRSVNGALFDTTHLGNFNQAKSWLEAYPESPYAATALAWAHLNRAFQFRGTRWSKDTSNEAMGAFQAERSRATALIKHALEQNPDYVPARDASIQLAMSGVLGFDLLKSVNYTLNLAPDRHTAALALSATRLAWNGSLSDNLAVCALLTTHLQNYDTDLCFIEVVYYNDVEGKMRQRTIKLLDERDEAFLDYFRIDAYLTEWSKRPEAFSELKRLHRNTLGPGMSVEKYRNRLAGIVSIFGAPLYEIEAEDALLKQLEKNLVLDPHNVHLLRVLIDSNIKPDSRNVSKKMANKAHSYWRAMLPLGQFRPETWHSGLKASGQNLNSVQGTRYATRLMNNVAHYSGYNPGYLGQFRTSTYYRYMWATGTGDYANRQPPENGEELVSALTCPLFQFARLHELSCEEAATDNLSCQKAGIENELRYQISKLADTLRESGNQAEKECANLINAPWHEVVVQPVPLSEFEEES